MRKSIPMVLLALLTVGCVPAVIRDDTPPRPREGEVVVLARLKVIARYCNQCEYRKNPVTGKLEVAHPELPPWSVRPVKYPGQVVLSTGGAMKRPIYLGRPTEEVGEVRIKLTHGDAVVALALKGRTTYSLSRYAEANADFANAYYFRNRLSFTTPANGIVYIGDIIMDISALPGDPYVGDPRGTSSVYGGRRVSVEDNEAKTLAALKEKFPGLVSGHTYEKRLIVPEPSRSQ